MKKRVCSICNLSTDLVPFKRGFICRSCINKIKLSLPNRQESSCEKYGEKVGEKKSLYLSIPK